MLLNTAHAPVGAKRLKIGRWMLLNKIAYCLSEATVDTLKDVTLFHVVRQSKNPEIQIQLRYLLIKYL